MRWLALRARIEQRGAEFGSHAQTLEQQRQALTAAIAHAEGTYQASTSTLTVQARQLTAHARTLTEQSAGKARDAAAHCLDYLTAVDPDHAAGSIDGLPTPTPTGAPHGGHQDPHGPPVPPAARPVTDTSRHRTHVYTEQPRGDGLADLKEHSDGIITQRHAWMNAGGHAHLRHGHHITRRQLHDRIMHGHDPITGTPTDWERGKRHNVAEHATAFTNSGDLVFAEAVIWDHPTCRAERAAVPERRKSFSIEVPANDIFGPNFRDHVRGMSRVGPHENPSGVKDTTFSDSTTILAVYRRDSGNHGWRLYTCFPNP